MTCPVYIAASEMKTRFDELSTHLMQGGTVILTNRRRPVAKIVPFDAATDESLIRIGAADFRQSHAYHVEALRNDEAITLTLYRKPIGTVRRTHNNR